MKYALEYLKLVNMHSILSQTFGSIVLPLSQDTSGVASEGGIQKGDLQGAVDLADQINSFLAHSNSDAYGMGEEAYTLEELKEAEQRRLRISELIMEELAGFFKTLLTKNSK